MNFYDFFINELEQRGMFNNQAKEVMNKVMTCSPSMEGRWDERITSYPENLTNILWLTVEQQAVEFIKENCPQAWFRPIFDKEHPLRKEFEESQLLKKAKEDNNSIFIGQRRIWHNPKYSFEVLTKKQIEGRTFWTIKYDDDGRKQTQTEDAILNKSIAIN